MITKKVKDLEKGDVIRTEYGTFDNWVTVEIQRIQVLENGSLNCKMYCKYLSGNKVIMYGSADDFVEIVKE